MKLSPHDADLLNELSRLIPDAVTWVDSNVEDEKDMRLNDRLKLRFVELE